MEGFNRCSIQPAYNTFEHQAYRDSMSNGSNIFCSNKLGDTGSVANPFLKKVEYRRIGINYTSHKQVSYRFLGAITQWCKFMSKNLNFVREISRGGRGRTRIGGATKKREISRTS